MEKRNPEEVAKDLENIDFAEIEEDDLREIFGGLEHSLEEGCGTNTQCICPPSG